MKEKILFVIIFLVNLSSLPAQKNVYLGGSAGYSTPLNLGRDKDQIGFHDVAKAGPAVAMNALWFYNERLSLGAEAGYQYNGGSNFWNVANYGEVSSAYHAFNLLLKGNFYFSDEPFRPYCGIAFGAYYLLNKLDFDSSQAGTANDQSVSYTYKQWKPGYAPEAGFLVELSKHALLDVKARLVMIPNLKEEVVDITDDAGYVIDKITTNPHGNQNHLLLSVGLLFEL